MARRPALRRRLLLVVTAAAAGLASGAAVPVAQGQSDRTAGRSPIAEDAAVVLLSRAVHSADALVYSGTQVLSTWGPTGATSGVVSLTHVPGTGTVMGVAPTVAGPGGVLLDDGLLGHDRETTRLEVRRLETSRASSRTADRADGSGLDDTVLGLLRSHYDLVEAAPASALGRPVRVVEARRPDPATGVPVAGRFWLDDDTGLVLRRETYDEAGALMRSNSFIDLDLVGTDVRPPTSPMPTVGASVGERVPTAAQPRLADAGFWMVPQLPGGMDLFDVRSRLDGDARVLHLAYSDGLSTLSVFQQHGRLEQEAPAGWTATTVGTSVVLMSSVPPQRVVWESGDVVFTLLGDASPAAVAAVVAAMPHDRADGATGLRARLGRGLARVGGFLNPFS